MKRCSHCGSEYVRRLNIRSSRYKWRCIWCGHTFGRKFRARPWLVAAIALISVFLLFVLVWQNSLRISDIEDSISQLSSSDIESFSESTPAPTTQTLQLRHIDDKRYMLELINAERAKAGLAPVILGDNAAVQWHAESSLQNCFTSHWGLDGLKPYMRYSLAAGYQSNRENGHVSGYCIKESNRYRPITDIKALIREAMDGWMDSPAHRDNILDRWHRRVSIGLAWDNYNFYAHQHFEGDYVEYDELPAIENGILKISGRTKNGVWFDNDNDLRILIFYDQPPHALTRGQVSRTYCYDNGVPIAGLMPSMAGGGFYVTHEFSMVVPRCPDPYGISPNASEPTSHEEAYKMMREAYEQIRNLQGQSVSAPWITAQRWTASGEKFSIVADLRELLEKQGDGVYTIIMRGPIEGEGIHISQYSIFHGMKPPSEANSLAP